MNFERFCQLATKPLGPKDRFARQEPDATEQDMAFRRRFEIRRARQHYNAGEPTAEEIRFLNRKKII
jgi:hypothetical protein